LLGLIVETVSGMPFSDYMQTRVFEPLGMTKSTTNPIFAPDLAKGYNRFFGFAVPASQPYVPGGLPSGYLISTTDDMSKFLLAQIHNQKADGTQLLDPELLAIMRSEPEGIKSGYGMGWLVMDQGNTIAHGGSLEFFQSFILIHPKQQTGLVLLINQNSLESMQFENNSVRNGLLALLQGGEPKYNAYGWIGWVLLTLLAADLLNHFRLFASLNSWVVKARNQKRHRTWIKIVIGIILPLFILVGIPLVVSAVKGGSPSWSEPFKYAPDIILWLLVGTGLNLIRNIIRAVILLHRPKA
jgi:CubicO group peptidase (beta-lactamase class C family)